MRQLGTGVSYLSFNNCMTCSYIFSGICVDVSYNLDR